MAAFVLTFAVNRLPVWGLSDPRVLSALLVTPAFLDPGLEGAVRVARARLGRAA